MNQPANDQKSIVVKDAFGNLYNLVPIKNITKKPAVKKKNTVTVGKYRIPKGFLLLILLIIFIIYAINQGWMFP